MPLGLPLSLRPRLHPRTPSRPQALLALLAAALLAPALADAQGPAIGVSPGEVVLPDAQAGQTVVRAVTVQNRFAEPTTFTVTTNGTAGGWTTVTPAGPVTVPANTNQRFELAIAVPDGTGPGTRTGQVTFTTEAKEPASGSGSSVQRAVGVLLNVTVGGEARRTIAWVEATAPDVPVGTTLLVHALARNDGNVRSPATARATVTPFPSGDEVLAQGEGTVELDAGARGNATIALGAGLPIGQYWVHVQSVDPPGFNATLDVKVTAAGGAPDGRLRAITNPIRVGTGKPVTFAAWFESTGGPDVAAARFVGEVRRDGEVVASLGSAARAVPSGTHANLTAVWTPASAGAYTVVGHVEYDGFRTPESEGRIEVSVPGPDLLWLVWVLIALVAAGGIVWFIAWRRRRDRDRRKQAPPGT